MGERQRYTLQSNCQYYGTLDYGLGDSYVNSEGVAVVSGSLLGQEFSLAHVSRHVLNSEGRADLSQYYTDFNRI